MVTRVQTDVLRFTTMCDRWAKLMEKVILHGFIFPLYLPVASVVHAFGDTHIIFLALDISVSTSAQGWAKRYQCMWCTTESIRVGAHQLLVLINKWYYPETNTKHAFVEQLCDFLGSSLTFVERSVVYHCMEDPIFWLKILNSITIYFFNILDWNIEIIFLIYLWYWEIFNIFSINKNIKIIFKVIFQYSSIKVGKNK